MADAEPRSHGALTLWRSRNGVPLAEYSTTASSRSLASLCAYESRKLPAVAAAVASLGLDRVKVTAIGVRELPECGTNDEVLAYHGLDVAGLVGQLRAAHAAVPQVA